MLTDKENQVIEATCKLHNLFCNLPVFHPSDIREECVHIHAIQNMVMAREAYRSNPKIFPVKNGNTDNVPIGIISSTPMTFVSFDNIPMASEKCVHQKKYGMKKMRIKRVAAASISPNEYIKLKARNNATNFIFAYFLQVRIFCFWVTIRSYISFDADYALLCATEAMEKLQEKI